MTMRRAEERVRLQSALADLRRASKVFDEVNKVADEEGRPLTAELLRGWRRELAQISQPLDMMVREMLAEEGRGR
jgi:hypothetical protein